VISIQLASAERGKRRRTLPFRCCSLITVCWSSVLVLLAPAPARAHPVPRSEHDRNVTVTWRPDGVFVQYRLEIDEYTLLTSVAKWIADQPGDTRKPIGRKEVADAYIARLREVIPDQLVGTLDGQPVKFTCTDARVDFLDSAQFRFKLKADVGLHPGRHTLEVEDLNFLDKKGRLAMKFDAGPPLTVEKATEPPESHVTEATEAERRTVAATVFLPGTLPPEPPKAESTPEPEPVPPVAHEPTGFWDLLRKVQTEENLAVLLDTKIGLGLILLLALVHGALHSISPGHGKTMVAAYLIGEQGTPRHAVILGLIVTLTHTSAAFVVALLLKFVLPASAAPTVQMVLGVGGGALVAFIGLWLFMQRLAGRTDHVHLGAHSHGNGHSHSHGEDGGHAHSHGLTPEQFGRVGWVRLILLGISGGVVPCWGAILWVLYCVTAGRYGLALWAVLAFSVGLAAVLILVGLSVVWGGRAGASRFRGRGWFRLVSKWLPIVGAALVAVIGVWLVKINLPK
jgi:ABC-type nickel/cobalt efflux system permease component RcnA